MSSSAKALQLAQQLAKAAPRVVVAKQPVSNATGVHFEIPDKLKHIPRHLFESCPIEKLIKQIDFMDFPDWCAPPAQHHPGVHFEVEKQLFDEKGAPIQGSVMKLQPILLNRFPFYIIGKSSTVCDHTEAHPSISSVHLAIVHHQRGVVCISDINSTNGVYLNGKRIAPKTYIPINEGDVVKLGVSTRNLILRLNAPVILQQQQEQKEQQPQQEQKESGVRRAREEEEVVNNNNNNNSVGIVQHHQPPPPKNDAAAATNHDQKQPQQQEREENTTEPGTDTKQEQEQEHQKTESETTKTTTTITTKTTYDKVRVAHILIKHKDVDNAVSKAPRNKGEVITRSLDDAVSLAKAIHSQLVNSSSSSSSTDADKDAATTTSILLNSKSVFDEAVKNFSECSTTKKNGEMGVIEKGALPNLQDFEDAALTLAPLQISDDVVVTHLGVHILFRIPDE